MWHALLNKHGIEIYISMLWNLFPWSWFASIHFFGERVNAFNPACILTLLNSVGLKSGLYNCYQIPRYSIVLRFRIQFAITAFGSSLLCRAKSFKEIKLSPLTEIIVIFVLCTIILAIRFRSRSFSCANLQKFFGISALILRT